MLQAVSFALLDSVNVLLIGIVVALAALLPRAGRFGLIATLLILGDWLGVFVLCLIVMLIFDGLEGVVQTFLDSPWFGILLIATGIVSLIATRFTKGDSAHMIERFLAPVRTPSWLTVGAGFLLGIIQSATSVPFYAGLAVLSVGDFSGAIRYGGLVIYASLALSLPTLIAVFVGWVRMYPESPVGRLFEKAGQNKGKLAKWAGYVVAVLLGVMGVITLI